MRYDHAKIMTDLHLRFMRDDMKGLTTYAAMDSQIQKRYALAIRCCYDRFVRNHSNAIGYASK